MERQHWLLNALPTSDLGHSPFHQPEWGHGLGRFRGPSGASSVPAAEDTGLAGVWFQLPKCQAGSLAQVEGTGAPIKCVQPWVPLGLRA